jgi:hypothetical protein
VRDTTALEGLFRDVQCSVDRLDKRVGGIEQRVNILSTNIEIERCDLDKLYGLRIQLDFSQFCIIMMLMMLATAIVVYFLATRFGG